MEQPQLTLTPIDEAPMTTNLQLTENPDLIRSMRYYDHVRLYFDCGDAGFVSLTREQARNVISELERFLGGAR